MVVKKHVGREDSLTGFMFIGLPNSTLGFRSTLGEGKMLPTIVSPHTLKLFNESLIISRVNKFSYTMWFAVLEITCINELIKISLGLGIGTEHRQVPCVGTTYIVSNILRMKSFSHRVKVKELICNWIWSPIWFIFSNYSCWIDRIWEIRLRGNLPTPLLLQCKPFFPKCLPLNIIIVYN